MAVMTCAWIALVLSVLGAVGVGVILTLGGATVEEGGMVTLRLGESADLVREAQRVGEVQEVEDPLEPGDPITLQQLPG